MPSYDNLDRETLIRLLQRRDAERRLGLVWERDEIEADKALNGDFVTLTLDPALSHSDGPWDNLIDGAGFYPDFIVSLHDRPGDGIALLEPKGSHLWGLASEVEKSTAVHPNYGRVFMVGRKRGEREFVFLRDLGDKLQSDGAFSIDRLRFQ